MALNNFKCNHLMPLHFRGLRRSLTTVKFRQARFHCGQKQEDAAVANNRTARSRLQLRVACESIQHKCKNVQTKIKNVKNVKNVA